MTNKRGGRVGRPSLRGERTSAILDATSRCVARFGVEGTTLEQIAAESGLSRSHVRHYVGNRADLIALFRERIITRNTPPDLVEALEPGASATRLVLRHLFDQPADLDEYAAVDAILAAARHDAALREEVRGVYVRLEEFIAAAVIADHPDWDEPRVATAASQVLYLAYGHSTMLSLGLESTRSGAARSLAAQVLQIPPQDEPGTGG